MKKILGISFIIVLAVMMSACANAAISADEASAEALPENVVMLEAGAWPDHAYTANIPQPQAGLMSRGWIDPTQKYCYIELSDMGLAQAEQYINTLEEAGFSQVEQVEEEISDDLTSAGILLTKASTALSIAYADDSFGMYIKNDH